MQFFSRPYLVAFSACILVTPLAWPADSEPRFSRDIQPILSNNCYECHGPDENARKADLRLDQAESARRVLEGAMPEDTELYQRITAEHPNDRMPPPESDKTLSPEAKGKLRAWLAEGAPYERHWAFVKPERPALPDVTTSDWPENAIDHFTLARMEEAALTPSERADRITLLRRVHFDLIGLPPSVDEIDAFVNDNEPDAYERVVDRLLSSPHFGERWGRHWLDVARYADSNGYSIDGPRSIWPYRDWVVDAFNANMPFDQFITEQLAGDLLPDATRSQKIATGFHRNTMINQEGGIDKEEFRLEAVFDRVNTTGSVLLGLTVSCARCHSHKYDPMEHREYYELMAFYNNDNEPMLALPTKEQAAHRKRLNKEIAALEKELNAYIDDAWASAIPEWIGALTVKELQEFEKATRDALVTSSDARDDEMRKLVREAFTRHDDEARKLDRAIRKAKSKMPDIPTTMILAARDEPRETTIFEQGDFTRKGDPVSPDTPDALHPFPEDAPRNRLGFARWLVHEDNPITARVTVNRFWQRLFGRGIVGTENDFGMQGTPPSHPELLDWLAVEFVESGWDVKHMLRLMVTSATYRQSSNTRDDIDAKDPRNVLLARQNRLRLDAEIIRDNALAVSGLLNPELGGPPVYPPQPDGVMALGQRQRDWNPSEGGDRYRRGMYTFFWRGTPHPALTVFDAPDAQFACTRRVRSNTPLQALTLLNDPAYVEMAHALGGHLADMAETDEAGISYAFRLCLGREPTDREAAILSELLAWERDATNSEKQAWTAIARAMLNLDEFITRE